MLLRCLHNGAGRSKFDLQEGVAPGVCSTSWSQCAFHSVKLSTCLKFSSQTCSCVTAEGRRPTPALFEAIFCSLVFPFIATCFRSPWKLPYSLVNPPPWPWPPAPDSHPHSVIGQLGLRGASAVAVGRLGWRVAIRLPLLGCVRSLRAGRACEQSQGPPAY